MMSRPTDQVRRVGITKLLGKPTWAFLGLLVLLQVGHIFIRGTAFQIHLDRAVWQYGFSMIFFGPAVASFGAFAGGRSARTAWLHHASQRRAALNVFAYGFGCSLAIYMAGLALAVGITAFSGTPLQPSPLAWQATATALLAIAGYLAAGATLGWVLRPVWAVTTALAGSFAVTFAGWFVAAPAVEFGGGGQLYSLESLTGNALVSRTVVFLGLVVSYVLWVSSIGRPPLRRAAAVVLGPLSVVVGFGVAGSDTLQQHDLDLVCADAERICVPKGSSHALGPAVEVFSSVEYLAYLRSQFPEEVGADLVVEESGFLEILLDAPRADRGQLGSWIARTVHGARAPRCDGGYRAFESSATEAEIDAELALYIWENEVIGLAYPPPPTPPPRPGERVSDYWGFPIGDDFEATHPLLPPADLDDPDARYFLRQVFAMLPDCGE